MRMVVACASGFVLLGTILSSSAEECSDPVGDVYESPAELKLDLVSFTVFTAEESLEISLDFGNVVTQQDLQRMTTIVDLDTDWSTSTGRTSHAESFGLPPFHDMGGDYYLCVFPFFQGADLYAINAGIELPVIQQLPMSVNGSSVHFSVPLSSTSAPTGPLINGGYRAAVLVSNFGYFTDRAPNGVETCSTPCLPGDFTCDGDVDADDMMRLQNCMSGPRVTPDPFCTGADFDHDGDVDQSDFGQFQVLMTDPA